MPLVRFGVKNEYKLGVEELYKDGVHSEDPKAVLDGVAVAGLVGVLRQLGDLAQFASEVFHGLQEQVASTSSRSRKLVNRVQRIEASLPSLEKAILSQTDHLHFAYTPRSEVHACVRIKRNHFICDDLPHFIMDSYEECREAPRLQLLDRFDSGGPGSCLRRYSDPTFFKRASSCSELSNSEKSQRGTKARKMKKRRSCQRSGQFPKSAPILNDSARMQFSSTDYGQSSLSHTGSNFDMTFKSDLGDQSGSRGSKTRMDFIDSVSHPILSKSLDQTKNKGLSSLVKETETNTDGYVYSGGQPAIASDEKSCSYDVEESLPRSSTATWDERLEVLEPTDVNCVIEDNLQLPLTSSSHYELEFKIVNEKGVNQVNDLSVHGSSPKSESEGRHLKTSGEILIEPSELNCGSNEVKDSRKTNFELHERHLEPPHLESWTQVVDLSEGGKPPEPTFNDNLMNDSAYTSLETGDAQYLVEANFDVAGKEMETTDSVDVSPDAFCNVKSIEWDQQESGAASTEHVSQVYAFSEGGRNVEVIEWNQRDLETINPQNISQVDAFSEGENKVKAIECNLTQLETVKVEHVGEMDITSEGGNNVKLIEWNQQELETQIDENVNQVDIFTEGKNTVQVIEWNGVDDIDSGTENFVDALNTIESESESEFETEMKMEVPTITSKGELGENTVNDQMAERSSHLLPEYQNLSTSYECKDEEDLEDLERPATSVTSVNMLSNDHTWSSHDQSESASGQELDALTCLDDEQSLETSQTATISDVLQEPDTCAKDPLISVEPAVSEIAKSGSGAPVDERIIYAPNVTQETSVGTSSSYPLAFWTNGTLLGLAPSKPVVFGMPNSPDSAPISNDNTVGQSSNDVVQKADGPARVLASPINESEHGSKSEIYDEYVGSSTHLSQQKLEKTHDTSVGHNKSNSSEHPAIRDLINDDAMLLESNVPVGTNENNVSSDATGSSEDRSSLLSMLSRGLLKNGLRSSGSLGYDEKNVTSSTSQSNEFDNRCQEAVSQPVPEPNLIGKLDSPVNSPPPSPPLGHMKISFQPVDGFDASRLKLKYPEGIDQYENTFDAFPSFQLVPESTKLQNDIGSDSDDDTFCRSYACMSDVSHIHQSDSDSEQWESGDSTESNDHTLYNGLHRISSTESASTSPQHEEADHENIHQGSRSVSNVLSLSDPSFYLPLLDAKNPFACQEMKLSVNPGEDSSHLQKSTNEPPPLPPLQWRVSRPLFNGVEDNQHQKSDSLSQSFVTNLSDSLSAHPAKVDSAKLISTAQEAATIAKSIESATCAKPKESAMIAKPKKQVEEQKFGQQQTYHGEKERKMDDGGDFLHQIRTKSFNLKRIEPTRPAYAPTTATSTKITAILQKANAIRQAVGSDDGEDDSWSDT